MTASELYEKLQFEPDYLVSVMVANNLPGLNQRAQQLRLSKADLTADGMFSLFDSLARQDRFEDIQSLTEGIAYEAGKLTKGNDEFFFSTFSPHFKQRPLMFINNQGNEETGPETPEDFWGEYDNAGGGQWWTDFDWGGVLNGLGGIISVFSTWGDNGEEVYDPTPDPNPNPNNNNNNNNGGNGSFFSGENLKTYGPWLAVAAIVLWLAYRKKL